MKKRVSIIIIILLSIFVTGKSYASTSFQDDFTATDGTSLKTHNNLWQGYSGLDNAIISNNQVHSSNGLNSSYYIPSLINLTDYCVQADFSYPLPQTQPTDFFDIATRKNNIHNIHTYEAGLSANGSMWLAVDYSNILFLTTSPISNGTHTLKLCSIGSSQSLYLDNNLLTTASDNTYSSGAPGFDLGNNTPIDNFIVTSATGNQNIDLAVSLLKQTSNPWQSQEYDSAHIWNPSDITINRWGCALTSAVMILQYYGIFTIPGTNFTPLDPSTLNAWLKNQPDGYVGTGWVNWQAIARLSKLAASTHIISSFDALEYERTSGADKTQLTDDIHNNIPDIMEEPGHFIVAKGINNTTFDINDPYYNRTTLNDGYNNSFLSLIRFIPSHTDLSYIMLTSNPDVTLTVKDSSGNSVGSSFVQSAITDPLDSTKTNSPIRIYYLPKPGSGNYTVSATSTTGAFVFTSYLYDNQGNPKIQNLNGFNTATYIISFDKSTSANSSTNKNVTFDNTIQDVKDAQKLHLINTALAAGLTDILTNAKKQAIKHPEISKALLNGGIILLKDSKNYPVLISQEVYNVLLNDFTVLNSTLK